MLGTYLTISSSRTTIPANTEQFNIHEIGRRPFALKSVPIHGSRSSGLASYSCFRVKTIVFCTNDTNDSALTQPCSSFQLLSPPSQCHDSRLDLAHVIGDDEEGESNYDVKTKQLEPVSIYTWHRGEYLTIAPSSQLDFPSAHTCVTTNTLKKKTTVWKSSKRSVMS